MMPPPPNIKIFWGQRDRVINQQYYTQVHTRIPHTSVTSHSLILRAFSPSSLVARGICVSQLRYICVRYVCLLFMQVFLYMYSYFWMTSDGGDYLYMWWCTCILDSSPDWWLERANGPHQGQSCLYNTWQTFNYQWRGGHNGWNIYYNEEMNKPNNITYITSA